jgi:hypothetical protein
MYTMVGECAVNGVKVESQLTWLPPGYTAPLEPRLLELDTRLVLRIRIHQIHMVSGLPDPDPQVRGMDPDPDPSIIMQT